MHSMPLIQSGLQPSYPLHTAPPVPPAPPPSTTTQIPCTITPVPCTTTHHHPCWPPDISCTHRHTLNAQHAVDAVRAAAVTSPPHRLALADHDVILVLVRERSTGKHSGAGTDAGQLLLLCPPASLWILSLDFVPRFCLTLSHCLTLLRGLSTLATAPPTAPYTSSALPPVSPNSNLSYPTTLPRPAAFSNGSALSVHDPTTPSQPPRPTHLHFPLAMRKVVDLHHLHHRWQPPPEPVLPPLHTSTKH